MKTAIIPLGAIREIEMVSGLPGVTKPSEPTFAFRKMNLVRCLPLAEGWAGGAAAGAAAGRTSAPTRAAAMTAGMRVALPADTRVTIAGDSYGDNHRFAWKAAV